MADSSLLVHVQTLSQHAYKALNKKLIIGVIES